MANINNFVFWGVCMLLFLANLIIFNLLGVGVIHTGERICKTCISSSGVQTPCECSELNKQDFSNTVVYIPLLWIVLAISSLWIRL